jgi:[CysO sulfur-carrier protein]-S-L-cysteine hydrolase
VNDGSRDPAVPVTIGRATLDAIVAHARREAPRECCGLLVGRGRTVIDAVPTHNIEVGETRYRVDPRQHFALIRRLRGSDRTIVGAYHSHPSAPARASSSDVREAFDATFVYLIVSLAPADGPAVSAFVVVDGRAEPLQLAVPDDGAAALAGCG